MYHFYNTSVIYVSQTHGRDDQMINGLAPLADRFGNGPFKTLERALEAVHMQRVSGNLRPMTIALTEDYFLSKLLNIDSRYHGLTLESYGARRKLLGGIRITDWKKDVFNGVDCLSAQLPPKADGTNWDFTDLIVNGKMASITRYPKEGMLNAVDTEFNDRHEVLGQWASSKWFEANKKDLQDIENIEDAIVNFYHYWIDEHTPVESYDPETGKLVMKYLSRFTINTKYGAEFGEVENGIQEDPAATHYYLSNIPCTFSEPGEWYMDRKAGEVYYIPRVDEDPAQLEAYAPVISSLIQISADDIRIRNLELMCTRGDYVSEMEYASDVQSVCLAPGAISFENAKRCSISQCYIHSLGVHAIEVLAGCQDIRIEENRIEDICAGGIRIVGGEYGCDPSEITSHCSILNNTIAHCGKRYAAGCGVLIRHASNNEISGNEIYDLQYSGISVGWVWGFKPSSTYGNRITRNHIHHIGGGPLSDLGGIYTLGKQPGTLIAENRIHDIGCGCYGAWGIYNDEGSSYMTVENNVIYNTGSESYHLNYGTQNVVRNNVFAMGGLACVLVSQNHMHEGLLLENNILVTEGKPMYGKISPHQLVSSQNIMWDVSGGEPVMKRNGMEAPYTFDEWTKGCGMDTGSVIADPKFTDLASFDFTLQADSPAVQMGFAPISDKVTKPR